MFAMSFLLAVVVFMLPVKFDSDAQLLVRLGRGTLSTDPTSNITPTVSVQETRLSQVSSVKEMLQSRALAEQTVYLIGADRILEPHGVVESTMQWLLSMVPSTGGGGGGGGTAEQSLSPAEVEDRLKVEEAIAKLQDNIEFTTTKNAYTIHVRVRSGSAYLSQDILNALIELYQNYHVKAYHSGGTLPFFEEQTAKSYKTAIELKDKIREAKNEMGIIEIESARASLREQLTQAEREFSQVEIDLASTTSEVERFQNEMTRMPERVQSETVTGITSNTGDGMRQQLYQLEMQAKELSSKLTPDHPQMRAIREQLDAASKIAATERKEQPQNKEAINPVFQQLELAYRSALVRLDGLKAKRESLKSLLADLDKQIVQLNQNEIELTKLTWEASLAESLYLQNAQSRDKALLLDALDREGFSEVSIVQPASLQLKKASPKRGILLVASLMLACGVAVLQALVRTVVTTNTPRRDDLLPHMPDDRDIDLAPRVVVSRETISI